DMNIGKEYPKLFVIFILIFLTLFMLIFKIIFIIPFIFIVLILLQYKDKFETIFYNFFTKRNLSYNFENGVFYNDKNANAVLVIDDIQLNYKDYNDTYIKTHIVSFHKILDIAKNVKVVLKREHVNKDIYIESLLQKIQSLRIMVESDPSNEKAKRKLELMENLISRIQTGETPFKYEMYIIVNAADKSTALNTINTIKQGLEGLGINSRLANSYEIKKLLEDFFSTTINSNKILLPLEIPYLTPIAMEKKPNRNLIENGIILGRELLDNNIIFWNVNESQNSHVMLIGPTGAGKTEFLIWLSVLLNLIYGSTIVMFDVKGDIKFRLSKYKIPYNIINPLFHRLGLLDESEIPIKIRILQIERIIFNSFKLNKLQSSIIYNYLNRLVDSSPFRIKTKWRDLEKYLNEIDDTQLKYYMTKIINVISSLDDLDLPLLHDTLKENEINVIDLTLIRDEEIKRLIIYTILYNLYNRLSLDKIHDVPKIFLVIDEAWTVLKAESEDYPIVADLVKRGRGHGISIMMATQNLEDLGELSNIFLDNVGLTVFMNNGDKRFWEEVRRFVTIDDDTLAKNLMFMSKGEALIRLLGDPRPIIIRLSNLSSNSF
ncbi:MAG: DNA import protein CedB, partial [Saccharolobus sp.]